MRVLLVGTSSSLKRNGWFAGLASVLGRENVVRKAIGHSVTYINALFALAEYSKQGVGWSRPFDVMIMQSNSRDHCSIVGEFKGPSQVAMGTSHFLSSMKIALASLPKDMRCIHVCFPCRSYYRGGDPSGELVREITTEFGVTHVSAEAVLRRAGYGAPDVFAEDDKIHVIDEVAFEFGALFAESLRHIEPPPRAGGIDVSDVARVEPLFGRSQDRMTLDSSVGTYEFGRFRSGDTIRGIGDGWLGAVSFNAGSTRAYLDIEARYEKLSKSICSENDGRQHVEYSILREPVRIDPDAVFRVAGRPSFPIQHASRQMNLKEPVPGDAALGHALCYGGHPQLLADTVAEKIRRAQDNIDAFIASGKAVEAFVQKRLGAP